MDFENDGADFDIDDFDIDVNQVDLESVTDFQNDDRNVEGIYYWI